MVALSQPFWNHYWPKVRILFCFSYVIIRHKKHLLFLSVTNETYPIRLFLRYFAYVISRHQLQSSFPSIPRDKTAADVYRVVNVSQPSFIRVEADEVTYPLRKRKRNTIAQKGNEESSVILVFSLEVLTLSLYV